MKRIDLRGVLCPINFVKAKLALEMLEPGETVQFLLDDGEAVKHVPRSIKGEGHTLRRLEESGGYYSLIVEKGA